MPCEKKKPIIQHDDYYYDYITISIISKQHKLERIDTLYVCIFIISFEVIR